MRSVASIPLSNIYIYCTLVEYSYIRQATTGSSCQAKALPKTSFWSPGVAQAVKVATLLQGPLGVVCLTETELSTDQKSTKKHL